MKCAANNKGLQQNREYQKGLEDGVDGLMVMMIYILADKKGFEHQELSEMIEKITDIADSVIKGYVNLQDLKDILKEEYDIEIERKRTRG